MKENLFKLIRFAGYYNPQRIHLRMGTSLN